MPCPSISFEVFPPATLPASFRLWDAMARLQAFQPDYISVTYGAQGSDQTPTLETAQSMIEQTGLPVGAHLTIARASREDVLAQAQRYFEIGVRDIVALRGDGDAPGAPFTPHPEGFTSSVELVEALAAQGRFRIRVGAYPESHPAAASPQQNIDYLKAKFDAGADEAITQFFFEPQTFLRFRDACAKAGIDKRIVPGILPIANWAKVRRFANSCGASVPAWLDQAFETAVRDDREALLGLAVTTELASKLVEEGVDHLHIYTLNSARLTDQLCTALGVEARPVQLRNVA